MQKAKELADQYEEEDRQAELAEYRAIKALERKEALDKVVKKISKNVFNTSQKSKENMQKVLEKLSQNAVDNNSFM